MAFNMPPPAARYHASVPREPGQGFLGQPKNMGSVGRPGYAPGEPPGPEAYMAARDHVAYARDPHGEAPTGMRFWSQRRYGDEMAISMSEAVFNNVNTIARLILPLQEHGEGTTYNWVIEAPISHVMDTTPELAPARRVQDRMGQRQVTLQRFSIGAAIESTAMINTEQGKKLWAMKMQQIAAAAARSVYIMMYNALLTGDNSQTLGSLSGVEDDERAAVTRRQNMVANFGSIQKNPFAIELIANQASQAMGCYMETPHTMLVPKGTSALVDTVEVRMTHSVMGKDKTELNNFATTHKKTRNGLYVLETDLVETEAGMPPIDPLSRVVTIGEHVVLATHEGHDRVGIENQDACATSIIEARDALWASQLFRPDNGSLDTTLVQKFIDHSKSEGSIEANSLHTPLVALIRDDDGGIRATVPNSFGAMDTRHLTPSVVGKLSRKFEAAILKAQLPSDAITRVESINNQFQTADMSLDVYLAAVSQAKLIGNPLYKAHCAARHFGMPDLNAGLCAIFALVVKMNTGTKITSKAIVTDADDFLVAVGGNDGTAFGKIDLGADGQAVQLAAQQIVWKLSRNGKDLAQVGRRVASVIAAGTAPMFIEDRFCPEADQDDILDAFAEMSKRGCFAGLKIAQQLAGYNSRTGLQYLKSQASDTLSIVNDVYPGPVKSAAESLQSWAPIETCLNSNVPNSWLEIGALSPANMYAQSGSNESIGSLGFNALVCGVPSALFVMVPGAAPGGGPAGAASSVFGEHMIRLMPSVRHYNANTSGYDAEATAALKGIGDDGAKATTMGKAMRVTEAVASVAGFLKMALAYAWDAAGPADKGAIKNFMGQWARIVSRMSSMTDGTARSILNGIKGINIRAAICLEDFTATATALPSIDTFVPKLADDIVIVPAGEFEFPTSSGPHTTALKLGRAGAGPTGALDFTCVATPLLMNAACAQQSVGHIEAAVRAAAAGTPLTLETLAAEGALFSGANPHAFPLNMAFLDELVHDSPVDDALHRRFDRAKGSLLMGASMGSAAQKTSSLFLGTHVLSPNAAAGAGYIATKLASAFQQADIDLDSMAEDAPWGIPMLCNMPKEILARLSGKLPLISRLSMAWVFGRFNVACISGMVSRGLPVPLGIVLLRNRSYRMGTFVVAAKDAGVTLYAHPAFKCGDSVEDGVIAAKFTISAAAAVTRPSRVCVIPDCMFLGALGGSNDVFIQHSELPMPSFDVAEAERMEQAEHASMYALVVGPGLHENKTWDVAESSFAQFLYRFGPSASQPPMDNIPWTQDMCQRTTQFFPGYREVHYPDGRVEVKQGSSPLGNTDPALSAGIRNGRMGTHATDFRRR